MEITAPFILGGVLHVCCHGGAASARSLVSAFRQRSLTTRMDGKEFRLNATLMKSPEMRRSRSTASGRSRTGGTSAPVGTRCRSRRCWRDEKMEERKKKEKKEEEDAHEDAQEMVVVESIATPKLWFAEGWDAGVKL